TVKGTASLLVPLGNVLRAATGSWMPIFVAAIALDWIGALLAFFVLKPLRIGWVSAHAGVSPGAIGPAATTIRHCWRLSRGASAPRRWPPSSWRSPHPCMTLGHG